MDCAVALTLVTHTFETPVLASSWSRQEWFYFSYRRKLFKFIAQVFLEKSQSAIIISPTNSKLIVPFIMRLILYVYLARNLLLSPALFTAMNVVTWIYS